MPIIFLCMLCRRHIISFHLPIANVIFLSRLILPVAWWYSPSPARSLPSVPARKRAGGQLSWRWLLFSCSFYSLFSMFWLVRTMAVSMDRPVTTQNAAVCSLNLPQGCLGIILREWNRAEAQCQYGNEPCWLEAEHNAFSDVEFNVWHIFYGLLPRFQYYNNKDKNKE